MNIPEDEKPVTKKELEATKLELLAKLENNATKDEIKNFATKDDLKNFATKDDLKKLATKEELKKLDRKVEILAAELLSMNRRMEKVESNTDLILQTLDGIVKRLDISETERAATEHAFRRHENMLDDHETRLTALEVK